MYLRNTLCFIFGLYIFNFDVILPSYVGERPRILLSVNARNEEHTLPTFFGYIDTLNYPKHRISVLIQTDHNEDRTVELINEWAGKTRDFYHKVDVRHESHPKSYKDTKGPCSYSKTRYRKVLKNHQISLDEARSQWADYLFQVTAGTFLLNPEVLNELIEENKPIISPMLELFYEDSAYSNFWGAMDEKGYYKSVPEYFEILHRKKNGSFEVPMIHSTILINMRDKSVDNIQYYPIPAQYKGAIDDVLIFAWRVKEAGVSLHVCNKNFYGYMMDRYKSSHTLKQRHQQFTDVYVDFIVYHHPLFRSEYINHTFPVATKKGFDEVFMINLIRRPDRRRKMELTCKELGLEFKYFAAVDGKKFTTEGLEKMGIKAMTDFKDPFLERPITFGEIGCFMSHWNIWLEMLDRELEMVLVLEDDVRFEADFNNKLEEVMKEARTLLKNGVEWDLMYLGRKPLISDEPEIIVYDCKKIVWAKYSYWTLAYVIRLSGAKQLVAGQPLNKMVPIDEYIPIKFNEHPNDELLELYYPRDMIGFSAYPLLVYPTHYVGEPGHFSDTEDTLSFEGKDVSYFKTQKLKERELEREKEKLDSQLKTESVSERPEDEVSMDVLKGSHDEL